VRYLVVVLAVLCSLAVVTAQDAAPRFAATGSRGVGPVEAGPFRGKAIDPRRGNRGIAIATEMSTRVFRDD